MNNTSGSQEKGGKSCDSKRAAIQKRRAIGAEGTRATEWTKRFREQSCFRWIAEAGARASAVAVHKRRTHTSINCVNNYTYDFAIWGVGRTRENIFCDDYTKTHSFLPNVYDFNTSLNSLLSLCLPLYFSLYWLHCVTYLNCCHRRCCDFLFWFKQPPIT